MTSRAELRLAEIHTRQAGTLPFSPPLSNFVSPADLCVEFGQRLAPEMWMPRYSWLLGHPRLLGAELDDGETCR